jgi:glycosyltransferase involved in cell wall biosynthesis
MRVLLVANANSIHTRRWALGLEGRGYTVGVASDAAAPDLPVPTFPLAPLKAGRLNLPVLAGQLRGALRAFSPDIVHAHYVSHYGLVAALAGASPLAMSVWGADVEVFPARSALNRTLLRWTLGRAARVTASSRYLADVTRRYLAPGRPVEVVPFGIDLQLFSPAAGAVVPVPPPLRLVSNKHLEPVYGGDLLLQAVAELAPDLDLVVEILGEGSWRAHLTALAGELGLADRVRLPGALPPEGVRDVLRRSHIAVFPSRRESFGVATLEASAAGLPVVATRVGGLSEVVDEPRTGLLVPPEDPGALAAAIRALAEDSGQRRAMGEAGVEWVRERYSWDCALDMMGGLYTEMRKTLR